MGNKYEQQRRRDIIRATFNAIADKGFYAVTLQDIADYAGVSKGVTSYYFDNKDDVFLNLLQWLTDRIYQNELAAINSKSDPVEKLRAYIDAVFVNPKENRKFYRVYLDFLAQGSKDPRYRNINNIFYENCWRIGKEITKLGKEQGVFDIEDVDKAALAMRSLIDGTLIQWLMRDQEELHSFYRDLCYETILNFLGYKHTDSAN